MKGTPSQQQPRELFSMKDSGVIVVDDTTTSSSSAVTDHEKDQGIAETESHVLTDKIKELSLEERNQAILELHGVAEVEEVTKDVLETKLSDMSRALDALATTEKAASYRKALERDKDYVNKKIKLLCLRADYYDVQKAAARVITFFNFKQSIFGDEKLGKEITLDDLTSEGRRAVDNGVFQLLQQRDRAGRGITLFLGAKPTNLKLGPQAVLQAFYYVHMQALRDEEIQKKGIVHILYAIGQEKYVSDRPAKGAAMWWLLPLRLVAMHFCYDTDFLEEVGQLLCQAMEAHHLCRFRAHRASALECIFILMTFGIPKEVLPFDAETGELDIRAHGRWIKAVEHRERTVLEMAAATPEPVETQAKEIVVPGPMDIVVGLGRQSISSTINSTGYLKFRDLLQDHRQEYENAGRFEKTIVANILLKKLRDDGYRFVRCTPEGVLSECDEGEAREKISHTFRNMRQKNTRRKGRQTGTTKRPINQS